MFDVAADRWVSQAAPRPVGLSPKLVYSPAAKSVLAVSVTGEVSAYDVAADSWTKRSDAAWSTRVRPMVGLDEESGDVVAIEPTLPSAWSYDVTAGEWTEIDQDGAIGPRTAGNGGMLMTYDPGVSGFVVLDYRADLAQPSHDVWRFDPQSGSWTELAAMPMISFGYFPSGQEATFAASSGRSVFASFGVVAEYDSASNSWTSYVNGAVGDSTSMVGEPKRMGAHLVYDPINVRVLMYSGAKFDGTDWELVDEVWAYDAVTHQWSLVLAAT